MGRKREDMSKAITMIENTQLNIFSENFSPQSTDGR